MRAWRVAMLAAGAALLPSVASAHLVQSGLGPFYDGLLYPLFFQKFDAWLASLS